MRDCVYVCMSLSMCLVCVSVYVCVLCASVFVCVKDHVKVLQKIIIFTHIIRALCCLETDV